MDKTSMDELEGISHAKGRPKLWKDAATKQAAYRARKSYADANREVSRLNAAAKDAQDACRIYVDALQAAALALWRNANPHSLQHVADEKEAREIIDRMSLAELLHYATQANNELIDLPRRSRQQQAIADRALETLQGLGL